MLNSDSNFPDTFPQIITQTFLKQNSKPLLRRIFYMYFTNNAGFQNITTNK
jgi:hypothetical protein